MTVLEYVIEKIAKRANEVALWTESPTKNYTLWEPSADLTESGAGYDVHTGRTIIFLELRVEYMADPWREVCLARLKPFFSLFYFPTKEMVDRIKLARMDPYYGHITETDSKNAAASINRFLDSVIVRVIFYVTVDQGLKFTRSCDLDNATGKVIYDEYRYPDK